MLNKVQLSCAMHIVFRAPWGKVVGQSNGGRRQTIIFPVGISCSRVRLTFPKKGGSKILTIQKIMIFWFQRNSKKKMFITLFHILCIFVIKSFHTPIHACKLKWWLKPPSICLSCLLRPFHVYQYTESNVLFLLATPCHILTKIAGKQPAIPAQV